MKEFSIKISNLDKGISPTPQQTKNTGYFTDVYGVKAGLSGIEAAPSISTLTDMPAIAWPLPQIIKTTVKSYVVSSTTLYELEPVTKRLIDLLTTLAGTRQYDVADFELYQIWTNGTKLLVRDETSTFSVYTVAAGGFIPYTLCNYRGQLIMGGLGADRKDWVSWSGIGEVNLDAMTSNRYGLLSSDYKNTAGNRKMPFSGQVYKVLPLDSGIMVYGENGIAALIPAVSPAPTYGMREFPNVNCSGAAGGGLHRHLFTDNSGYLWSIDSNLKLERLGYNRTFAGKTVVIQYEDTSGDFYLSTSTDTYLLSAGLSRLTKILTSIAKIEGTLIAPYTAQSSTDIVLVSDILDFGMRGIKEITAVEVATDSEDVYVAVDYRFRPNDAFVTSTYKKVYKNGMVFPIVSGNEFKVRVKGTNTADFSLSYLNIRYKVSDKRSVRGVYVTHDKALSRADSKTLGDS